MVRDVTGVLLAGGKSTRMGRDKRFLTIGDSTLFDRGLSTLCSQFQHVLIVIAQDGSPPSVNVAILRDIVPQCGSLGGLYTGLRAASTSHVFVAACDMPFLNVNVIRYMIGLKDQADIVVASWQNRIQPTHAIYSKRCVPVLEGMISHRQVKIQPVFQHPSLAVRFVTEEEVRKIDPEGRSFVNVNRPADLDEARRLGEDWKDR